MTTTNILWLALAGLVYMAGIWYIAPRAKTVAGFFGGQDEETGREPKFWVLVSSAAISWIFAKSIVNSANLGQAFGIWGSIGYALYYVSFIVAGIAIYYIRTRTKSTSLPNFLQTKYGTMGMKLFLFAVGIRLFNEVWSNTKVVGQFFGTEGSAPYWIAVGVFTTFTVMYSWRGGLRGSLLTDAVQMAFAAVLLAIVLYAVSPDLVLDWPEATIDMQSAALTFCLLALVQSLSYPFHDPVLTDRGFLTAPKKMLLGFIAAGLIGGIFIVLFGLVGVFATSQGFEAGNAALSVGIALGMPLLLIFNVMMLTSAGSTLDSTFASIGKMGVLDWRSLTTSQVTNSKNEVPRARKIIIWLAVLGNIPLLSLYMGDQVGPAIIAATTISGTMVMGLAPVVLLSWLPTSSLNFHAAFWPGFILGCVLAFAPGVFPDWVPVGSGKYALTTGVNIYGLILCTVLFVLASVVKRPVVTYATPA